MWDAGLSSTRARAPAPRRRRCAPPGPSERLVRYAYVCINRRVNMGRIAALAANPGKLAYLKPRLAPAPDEAHGGWSCALFAIDRDPHTDRRLRNLFTSCSNSARARATD